MESVEFERYLHLYFPVSRHLGVRVLGVGPEGVRLGAPLAANFNRGETAFGGSLSALAILAAWSWLRLQLDAHGFAGSLVIQRNAVEYLAPATSDFEAFARSPEPSQWERFRRTLERRGRARIELDAELRVGEELVARFRGEYVALAAGEASRAGHAERNGQSR
jgi:thioesterase domain-containing protein